MTKRFLEAQEKVIASEEENVVNVAVEPLEAQPPLSFRELQKIPQLHPYLLPDAVGFFGILRMPS